MTGLRHNTAIAFLTFMAIWGGSQAEEVSSWLRLPEERQVLNLDSLPSVPKPDIYEVVPTKSDTALVWHLAKNPVAALTCEDADFLTGGHYRCDRRATPVLVRAVFMNGGTGAFVVRYDAQNLYVTHASMGNESAVKNIPLIVNLPFVPKAVYAWTGLTK